MPEQDRPTSLTLLVRALNQDQEAWQRLMCLYSPLVMKWCASQHVHNADAEDVCQEVFNAVAKNLSSFQKSEQTDSFRGWLRGITRHKLLDHYRKTRRQPLGQGGTDAHLAIQHSAEPELPPDSVEDLSDLYKRALELVRAEFEANTWTAFWRVAVEGQQPALVADEMQVTPAAVRKAKSRVLHRLRQELGELLE